MRKILISLVVLVGFGCSNRPAPFQPTPEPVPVNEFSQKTIELFNRERAAYRLSPVVTDATLECAARAHSEDMAEHHFISHTGSDGSGFVTRIIRCGGQAGYNGEIVAAGQQSPQEVVESWMNSRGHRNIILGNYTKVGIAFDEFYWTATFSR